LETSMSDLPNVSSDEWLRINASWRIWQGLEWQDFRQNLERAFKHADVDGDGVVTSADLVALRERGWSALRACYLKQLRGLDADGDQKLVVKDIAPEQIKNLFWLARNFDIKSLDADGDGAVAIIDVANELVRIELSARENGSCRGLDNRAGDIADACLTEVVLVSLDRDGDGAVSASEYEDILREFFRSIDIDGDDLISAREALVYYDRVGDVRRAADLRSQMLDIETVISCARKDSGIGELDAASRLVDVFQCDGDAQSLLAIGGTELYTGVTDIEIAETGAQLILVLRSECPMIWRLNGGTSRIDRALVFWDGGESADPVRAGVIGLPRSRITFVPNMYFRGAGSQLAYFAESRTMALDSLESLLGRKFSDRLDRPNAPPSKRHIGTVCVPDMTGPGADLWRLALRTSPHGLAAIDASHVVTDAALSRYAILPGAAGLAQLLGSGAIQLMAKPEFETHGNVRLQAGEWEFRILKKIMLPPLVGGTLMFQGLSDCRFVVAPGVDWPYIEEATRKNMQDGISYVVIQSEETGESMTI
jgi:hypothetical protein